MVISWSRLTWLFSKYFLSFFWISELIWAYLSGWQKFKKGGKSMQLFLRYKNETGISSLPSLHSFTGQSKWKGWEVYLHFIKNYKVICQEELKKRHCRERLYIKDSIFISLVPIQNERYYTLFKSSPLSPLECAVIMEEESEEQSIVREYRYFSHQR